MRFSQYFLPTLKDITSEMKRNLLRTRYNDFALLLEETWAIKKESDFMVLDKN